METTLIITIGVQCSGKSTWAKQYAKDNPEFIYLSTDEIWLKIGPMQDRSIAKQVYSILEIECINALMNNKSVILDATFIKKSWRKKYINIGKVHADKVIAQVFIASRKELLKRLENRVKNGGLNVPVEVIDKYINMFESPDNTESFDQITLNLNG